MAVSQREKTGAAPDPDEVVISGIASSVILNYAEGTAHKTYRPGLAVRLLYWLVFQAQFPYVSNHDAIEAARHRRRIVGLLTRYWYGEDLVAPVVDIHEEDDGRIAFVSQLVRGCDPDRREVRRFLKGLTQRFIEAGLPTWQVSPYNPRSPGNIVETENGTYRIIDLESNLVAPIGPLSALVGAVRQRNFPAFDDINPETLREYIAKNQDALYAALGSECFDLTESVDAYTEFADHWHGREPRVFSRVLAFLLRLVDAPTWRRSLQRALAEGQRRAEAHMRRGITTWQNEGRLSKERAEELRAMVQSQELALALTHLGAHMAISVPLRFPIGGLTRSLWTFSHRLKAEWVGLRQGRAVVAERAVHTLPVGFATLIPGFGAGAYLLSKPLLEDRALAVIALDLMLRKLPFSLYAKARLRNLMDAIARPRHGGPQQHASTGATRESEG